MNAQTIKPAYADLLPAETFRAWRILGDGTSLPLDISAGNLAEAVEAAMQCCQHKDHFTVLQITAGGRRIEHVYYVKQGKPMWVRKPGFAHPVQIKPLSFEHRFSRQLEKFVPVEPFRWSPDCDVVGIDRQLVEQR